MGHITDGDTRVILQRLAILIPAYYVLYYVISVVIVASFGLPWLVTLTIPFQFRSFGFGNPLELAAWLDMVIAFVLAAFLVFVIVRSKKRAWDYAVTLAVLHLGISCAVGLGFPLNWVWWVTIVGGTFVMSTVSELLCYFLLDLREIRLDR